MDLSRRKLLAVTGAALVAGGCSRGGAGDETDQQGSKAPAKGTPKPADFTESPMLAARTRSGELPSLQERLPQTPYIVRPGVLITSPSLKLQAGRYGGTLQLGQEQPSYDPVIFLANVEPLLWAVNAFDFQKGLDGNVAEGYEVNSDNTKFTFHLRRGLHWSDGEDVTTDDLRFTFDDIYGNAEVTPIYPVFLRPGQRPDLPPAKLEIVDDLSFRLTFSQPYGAFLSQVSIAAWRGYSAFLKPRHYLEQFHKKYASKQKLKEMLKAESIPESQWFNLLTARMFGESEDITNPNFIPQPTLTPWVMKKAKSGTYDYERNPYYFKVDTGGRQLPYVDNLRGQLVQSKETLTSRALFGDFDYLGERASLRQLPVIADKARTGEIRMDIPRMHRLPISFALNLTFADDAWRKVVQDVRFRQALDLAINRKEIIDNFYLGKFARLPTQTSNGVHDVARANRLLDEMGMTKRSDAGLRLDPDGAPFRIPFQIQDLSEDHIPMGELIAEYWKKVGIDTTVRPIDPSLYGDAAEGNKIQATAIWQHFEIWANGEGFSDDLPGTYWGPLWQEWNDTRGDSGEEPPAEVKKLFDLHGDLISARVATPASRKALEGILASYRENVWTFCPVEHSYYPTFWNSRVQNVPTGAKDESFGLVNNMAMEQWFIAEGGADQ